MNNIKFTLPPNVDRFRLGIYTPDYSQPLSFLRVLGPFAEMAREDPRLELVYPEKIGEGWKLDWTWMARCDAIFYSHPSSDTDISVLWLAKNMGIPIWTEFVDDIFNVRKDNPHFQHVKNPRALRENITKSLEWATVNTTVSTLCRDAYPHPEKTVVIPEYCPWPMVNLPRRKCVSWRGLSSHDADVASVMDQLCAVAADFPDWEWVLMGTPSEEFQHRLKEATGEDGRRVIVAPWFSTPFHQFQAWAGKAPYLHIVPLMDDPFNRSKSHLAWLEASAIGAGVIVPAHLPEWQQPGVIPYDDGAMYYPGKADFATTLRREMLGYDSVQEATGYGMHLNVAAARSAIYPNRQPGAINQLRWAVLRRIMGFPEDVLSVASVASVGSGEN